MGATEISDSVAPAFAERSGVNIDAVALPDQDSLRKDVSYVIGRLKGCAARRGRGGVPDVPELAGMPADLRQIRLCQR